MIRLFDHPYFFYGIGFAALLVMVLVTVLHMDTQRPRYDGRQMMFMSYNLAEKGVLSREQDDAVVNPEPTFRREPLLPLIQAAFIKAYPGQELAQHGARCFLEDDLCPELIRFLKIPGILLHALLAFATAFAAWVMTRRRGAALAAFVAVCLYTGFMSVTNVFYAETLAALLFVLTSAFMYRAFAGELGSGGLPPHPAPGKALLAQHQPFAALSQGERDTGAGLWRSQSRGAGWVRGIAFNATLCGLCLGLLILTKAVFYYFLIVCVLIIPVLALLAVLRKTNWRFVANALLVCAVAAAVIAPWMIRNHNISGEWVIAGRGGEVLSIRAQYDTMPWSDYIPAYMMFTPLIGDKMVQRFYGPEVYARLDRETPGSYYDAAKRRQGVANRLAEEKGISLTKASLLVIKDNFAKHMALTLAFAYKGAFMQAYVREQPLPLILIIFTAAISLPFVPIGLALTLWAAVRREWGVWVFLFPAYFSYAFHAFLTHYIPRYSMPLIPVFIVAALVFICWMIERKAGRATT